MGVGEMPGLRARGLDRPGLLSVSARWEMAVRLFPWLPVPGGQLASTTGWKGCPGYCMALRL